MQWRKGLSLTVFVLGVLAMLWTPREAEAVEFQLGARAKGGGGSTSIFNDGDVNATEEPSPGFSVGAQGFALLGFSRSFSFGVDFNYAYIDNEGQYGDYGFHLPSLGAMMRLNFSSVFAFDGWINYSFGSLDADYDPNVINRADRDYDLSGVEFGLQPSLRLQLKPYRTFFEIGAYLSYTYASIDNFEYTLRNSATTSTRDIEWGIVQYGITLGMVFDFGSGGGKPAQHRRQYGEMSAIDYY